jgi:hypothetical protein
VCYTKINLIVHTQTMPVFSTLHQVLSFMVSLYWYEGRFDTMKGR